MFILFAFYGDQRQQCLLTVISQASGFKSNSLPITISGTNFVTGCQVTHLNLSTTISGTVFAFTATKLTGTFPLNGAQAGIYNLHNINPGGPNTTNPNAFNLKSPAMAPTIDNYYPISGANNAALPITINGSFFRGGAVVTIVNGTTNKTVAGTATGTTKLRVRFL